MVSGVKRRYDSSRRQVRADATRRHVIETATPLFIEHGYEATSMRLLADAAGVSPQTLYNTFGSKYGVFSSVIDVVVAGDHEPLALGDRPEFRALDAIDDPGALVRAIVTAATHVLVRLDAIYPTLRAAATSDPQVAAAYQRFALDARYEQHHRFATRLHDLGALPTGVDTARAADVLWTVLSPDTFHLLAGHRHWSVTDFETWATDTLVATLTTGPHRRRRS